MVNKTTAPNNTQVKQARPKDKEYNLADGGWFILTNKTQRLKAMGI